VVHKEGYIKPTISIMNRPLRYAIFFSIYLIINTYNHQASSTRSLVDGRNVVVRGDSTKGGQ